MDSPGVRDDPRGHVGSHFLCRLRAVAVTLQRPSNRGDRPRAQLRLLMPRSATPSAGLSRYELDRQVNPVPASNVISPSTLLGPCDRDHRIGGPRDLFVLGQKDRSRCRAFRSRPRPGYPSAGDRMNRQRDCGALDAAGGVHKKNPCEDRSMGLMTKGNIFPRGEMYRKNVLQAHHGISILAPGSWRFRRRALKRRAIFPFRRRVARGLRVQRQTSTSEVAR